MGMFEVSFHRYQRYSANISSNLSPNLFMHPYGADTHRMGCPVVSAPIRPA